MNNDFIREVLLGVPALAWMASSAYSGSALAALVVLIVACTLGKFSISADGGPPIEMTHFPTWTWLWLAAALVHLWGDSPRCLLMTALTLAAPIVLVSNMPIYVAIATRFAASGAGSFAQINVRKN